MTNQNPQTNPAVNLTPEQMPANQTAPAVQVVKPAPEAVKAEGPQNFDNFGLPSKLLQSLARMKFTAPTPIQAQAIPLALSGSDILGSAQTGTGKTGAFGIPLIARLMEDPNGMALVMTPTRELATQVAAALQQMIPLPNLKIAVLIGGESMFRQLRQLEHKPRIIVGTPGRINDHLERRSLRLDTASFLVLDETDRMLDMGFGPQIDQILKFMTSKRQTMMFSATLPENIVKMSRKYMNDAKRIAVGSATSPILKIKQETIRVSDVEKYAKLVEQLNQRQGSVIVFVKTKYGTEKLADKLSRDSHRSDAIHGDLQQRRRDRVIQGFRDKKYRILVATDVAARGLDIPHIEHVINYDLPQCPEDYIHRIGRTARAGAEGAAINFVTPSDNAKWNAIHRLMHGKPDPESRGGSSSEGQPKRGGGNWRNKRRGNGSNADGGRPNAGGPKKQWGGRKGGGNGGKPNHQGGAGRSNSVAKAS